MILPKTLLGRITDGEAKNQFSPSRMVFASFLFNNTSRDFEAANPGTILPEKLIGLEFHGAAPYLCSFP